MAGGGNRLWSRGCESLAGMAPDPGLLRESLATHMTLPRRLKPLSPIELSHLTVARLLAYRKQALSLENSVESSDYGDQVDALDQAYIWFKEDPRWQPLYDAILAELAGKQRSSARRTNPDGGT